MDKNISSNFLDRLRDWLSRSDYYAISHVERLKAWLRRRRQIALGISSPFFQYGGGADEYVVMANRAEHSSDENGFPIPPRRLWLGYADSPEEYLKSGQFSIQSMSSAMEESGMPVSACNRILDFGCGGGRMIRWLRHIAARGEVWGVDISADHIFWCAQYLSPPFHFATTTALPHLPFEDRYFDFVYAGSVFTHIDDLAPAWLQELRRILKPGGRMYITIQDNHTVSILEPEYIKNELPEVIQRTGELRRGQIHISNQAHGMEIFRRARRLPYQMIVYNRRKDPMVFYDLEYFKNSIASNLKTISVHPESQHFQTAVILER